MNDIQFVKPKVLILTSGTVLNNQLRQCELMGRICYNSLNRMQEHPFSMEQFLGARVKDHHESVLEHASLSVILYTSRAVSHQMVRHRLCAFSQQSQRYVKYKSEPGEVNSLRFIQPSFFAHYKEDTQKVVKERATKAGNDYFSLIRYALSAEEARELLPNCTATTIGVTANIREWRHIFKERLSRGAQPEIANIIYPIFKFVKKHAPFLVEDVTVSNLGLVDDYVEVYTCDEGDANTIGDLNASLCGWASTYRVADVLNTFPDEDE